MRVGEGLVGTIAAQGNGDQHRRRPEPPELPLLPGDPRGDLPLLPGRADPARRPRRRRADGAEPGPARLCRGRDRGDADHRLDPGRDVRLRRAGRSRASMPISSARSAAMRRARRDRGWSRAWRSARPGCTSRASRSPGCWPRTRRPSWRAWTGRPSSCARRSIRCSRPATSAAASSARCSRPTGCSRRTPAGCAASARRSAPASRPRPRSAGCRRRHASGSATPAIPICASG